ANPHVGNRRPGAIELRRSARLSHQKNLPSHSTSLTFKIDGHDHGCPNSAFIAALVLLNAHRRDFHDAGLLLYRLKKRIESLEVAFELHGYRPLGEWSDVFVLSLHGADAAGHHAARFGTLPDLVQNLVVFLRAWRARLKHLGCLV